MRMIVLYNDIHGPGRLYKAITGFYRALYGFYRAFIGFIWLYMGLYGAFIWTIYKDISASCLCIRPRPLRVRNGTRPIYTAIYGYTVLYMEITTDADYGTDYGTDYRTTARSQGTPAPCVKKMRRK